MTNSIKLHEIQKLLQGSLKGNFSKPTLEMTGVFDDHRKLIPGGVFVAVRGSLSDGHQFIEEILKKKPSCIIFESLSRNLTEKFSDILWLQVPNSRLALDRLANFVSGNPGSKLFTVAVTGTNGKTTITHMVEYLFNHFQIPTGVIGTINHHLGKNVWDCTNTSPGSLELYSRLSDFLKLGATAVTLEASSHALEQFRLDSLDLDVAIFTNLTRDHLDYHKTMEAYFQSKNKLFADILRNSKKSKKFAILNSSEWTEKFKIPSYVQKWTIGQKDSDWLYKILEHNFSGVKFKLTFQQQKHMVQLKIPGRYNVENAICAMAAVHTRGISLSDIIKSMETFTGVRGRLEKVSNKKNIHAFVDYAHTPDALENVLKCLNQIREGLKEKPQIITVFGCGGDRDPGKRPLMGKIATELSDWTVVTSDNPRTENPEKILADIKGGLNPGDLSKSSFCVDRTQAMKIAIEKAKPNDVILVAGKGHETYQILGTKKIDFDDVTVLGELLK